MQADATGNQESTSHENRRDKERPLHAMHCMERSVFLPSAV